ncbi:MAG: helix-turn-helix domain-containing protein [Clostridiaceae bacterium]|nr:helix-turn-helix domain-containing protein [Clostridiaceae bacterium]
MEERIDSVVISDEMANKIARMLGDILRDIRTQKRISQHTLSESVEINSSYYSLIENGEVNLTLRKFLSICAGLGIGADEIMRLLVESIDNYYRSS